MSSDSVHWHQWARSRVSEIDTVEQTLWIVALCALIGDVVTTAVGLRLGLVESNPFARVVINSYGVGGMLVLKGFALGAGLCCRPLLPRAYTPIIPAGLALPWTVAVVINCYTILTFT